MLKNGSNKERKVGKISPEDNQRISDFLQGAVYCWCKNKKGPFSLKDLMGGDSYDWNGTPLIFVYKTHHEKYKKYIDKCKKDIERYNENIENAAAKDCGKVLKNVVSLDKRNFDMINESGVNCYKWDRTEKSE